MNIRNANKDDVPAITEIYNHYIRHTVATFHEQSLSVKELQQRLQETQADFPWLVGEVDGQVIAYSYARAWRYRQAYRYSVESTIYVRDGYYGHGYGTALYRSLIEELSRGPFHVVLAGITLPNDASVSLHEKLGFRKTAHFDEIGRKFDQWLDVGYWQLILPDK